MAQAIIRTCIGVDTRSFRPGRWRCRDSDVFSWLESLDFYEPIFCIYHHYDTFECLNQVSEDSQR